MSAEMIERVCVLIGTARPSPMPAIAVLTPTTRPRPSTSAPPELPGFSAASVWMTLSTTRCAAPERTGSERPSADTTPAVTEPGEAVRVADRDDELADAQPGRVAEHGRVQVARVGAQDGEIGQRVGADDVERQLAAVDERRDAAGAGRPRRRAPR